jgi:DNA repair ATPase RecN
VVEGVSGQIFGKKAADEEARQDRERLEEIAHLLGGETLTPITLQHAEEMLKTST